MAPVVKEFQKHTEQFDTIVCVTGQHREMLDQVLKIFEIVPDFDLNVMQAGQDLTDVTTRVLARMRDVLKETKPDIVLVHGDTTTSSASALAAFYQKINVGHVEAGLRTYNIYSPWPEEINRQITGRIATWHFTPTAQNRQNLLNEGIPENKIFITGNTVIDALYLVLEKIKNKPAIIDGLEKDLVLHGLPLHLIQAWKGNEGERRMIMITGHRRENFGEGFANICEAILALSVKYPYVDFVYPVHLNPNVREPIQKLLGGTVITGIGKQSYSMNQNIYLIEPLEYMPFIHLMQKCTFILTDSGGIQEEASGLSKPVLVMRNETERTEGVKSGTIKLTGTNKDKIISEVEELLKGQNYHSGMSASFNPYGDGKAAEKIHELLI
jgi:UDP-N-acetylglucosamine 2-epimerase (non-hydrolysing)